MAITATTTGTTNISTGEFNGRIAIAPPPAPVDNTPYYVQIVETDGSIEIVNSLTGECSFIINTNTSVVATLAQVDLALDAYTDLFIGTKLSIVDYDGTGDGCTIQKTSTSNGDFADWIVIATDNTVSTGAIGVNPI
jgi:hypothetical protein